MAEGYTISKKGKKKDAQLLWAVVESTDKDGRANVLYVTAKEDDARDFIRNTCSNRQCPDVTNLDVCLVESASSEVKMVLDFVNAKPMEIECQCGAAFGIPMTEAQQSSETFSIYVSASKSGKKTVEELPQILVCPSCTRIMGRRYCAAAWWRFEED